ncbi:2-phosphosulfolactate phosphatase [Azoarcus sp. Aa7]|nr:2-phosphosulfolactate phosphatase [Azoarcus sp. Aa7]
MANSVLHVITRKEDLDTRRISAQVVLVVDTLFATTSIVTALAEGAETVVPALDEHEARSIAAGHGDPERLVLAGEYMAQTPPGFHSPPPLR